jgi:hypothetical protein
MAENMLLCGAQVLAGFCRYVSKRPKEHTMSDRCEWQPEQVTAALFVDVLGGELTARDAALRMFERSIIEEQKHDLERSRSLAEPPHSTVWAPVRNS